VSSFSTKSVIEQSARHIAGGVVSLNRKVQPHIVFTRASGSRIWDADGREFIDYHAAFAPHLLGHNHPAINGAVRKAMEDGWSLVGGGTTPWEAALAALLCPYFMEHPPRDWHDILMHHDFELDRRYHAALIARGIYHFPLPCKQGSVSTAHSESDIDCTLEATREAVKEL
jgi:glutamate-1-semialdehyde aminotransferase